jgi:hypothetical protein
MKLFLFLLLMPLLFFSCKKENEPVILPPAQQATFRVELKLQWTSPNFTIPANAHFTSFIGMVHHKDSFLWAPNGLATTGLEFVAEVGSNWRLNNEIDTIISKGKALSRFEILPPAITAGFDSSFNFTLQHSCFSFVSMLAPSPDWFIGINQYNLLQNGQWVKEINVPLYLYDAGTEDGDIFGYNNPATLPQQPVRLLTPATATVLANGNTVLAPIGYIRISRL